MLYNPQELQKLLKELELTDDEKVIFILREYTILYNASLEAQKIIIDECKSAISDQAKLHNSYLEDVINDATIIEN